MTAARRWASSLVGLLVGIVVLVLVTAILAAAVSSSHTSSTVSSLARQLEDANTQLDQLRADNAAAQRQSAASRAHLTRQNRALQRKLDVLVAFLRANGLPIPAIAEPPPPAAPEPQVRPPAPKAPASRPPKPRPASPAPTAIPAPVSPSPTGAPDLSLCELAPALC